MSSSGFFVNTGDLKGVHVPQSLNEQHIDFSKYKFASYTPHTSLRTMTVTIEAPTREDLLSMDAKFFALKAARENANFFANSILKTTPPYPVNEQGETTPGLMTGKDKIAAWRMDVVVINTMM